MIPPLWPEKDPSEVVIATFDYSAELETGEAITGTPAITASVVDGTDPTPSAILSGSPLIAGGAVRQFLTGGVSGVTYHLRCLTTMDSGRVLLLTATLPVRTG